MLGFDPVDGFRVGELTTVGCSAWAAQRPHTKAGKTMQTVSHVVKEALADLKRPFDRLTLNCLLLFIIG